MFHQKEYSVECSRKQTLLRGKGIAQVTVHLQLPIIFETYTQHQPQRTWSAWAKAAGSGVYGQGAGVGGAQTLQSPRPIVPLHGPPASPLDTGTSTRSLLELRTHLQSGKLWL